MIPFNKPYLTGKETHYIYDAVNSGKLSGNGKYTQKCQSFFESKYGFKKCLLTTSCTDALEMAAILAQVKEGDEVIVPSFTFVSTAIAFIRQGAKIVFADSCNENPNIDPDKLQELITEKTKVIVPVHYAGVACDMDKIMSIAEKHGILVIEDAAQAIDSYFIDKNGQQKPLGSIGHMAAFSFHETKNIISGEGGLLTINDSRFIKRSEVIWEKGTNRAEFFRGEVNKYGWVDIGSSFLPSEIIASFLWAQIENIDQIQNRRKEIWSRYYDAFKKNGLVEYLPKLPRYSTNNAHMFYLIFKSLRERTSFINYSKSNNILSVFHYLSLHKSEYYTMNNLNIPSLPESDNFSNCLVRIPLFYNLSDDDIEKIITMVCDFFKNNNTSI